MTARTRRVARFLALPVIGVSLVGGSIIASSRQGTDAATAVTFYVSQATGASDSNPGTLERPVRTVNRGVALASAANTVGNPATVKVAAGVYRESVMLEAGQRTDAPIVIDGPGAVLSGSDLWNSGWTKLADGTYRHSWPYRWGMAPIPSGWETYWNRDGKGYLRDRNRRREGVFVNGIGLSGRLNASELSQPSTFFVDETAGTITLRPPAGVVPTKFEVAMRTAVLKLNGRRNLTIRGLGIEHGRGAVREVAVPITNSRNIVLENVGIRGHAATGLATAYNDYLRLSGGAIASNGIIGWASYRDQHLTFENSTFTRNNWRGYPNGQEGWESVFKWGGTRDSVARGLTMVDNYGTGFWLDTDARRVTLENSLIARNRLSGVNVEKNYGPIVVRNNRICDNAQANISDAQSNSVTLTGNKVFGASRYALMFTGNYAGQSITDWQTGSTSVVKTRYWNVTGNTFVGQGGEGWLVWHTDYNAPGAWGGVVGSMPDFNYNTWFHRNRTAGFRLPVGAVDFSTYKRNVQSYKASAEASASWMDVGGLTCG